MIFIPVKAPDFRFWLWIPSGKDTWEKMYIKDKLAMGKRIRDKESALSNANSNSGHHTHPGRVWGILHVIKYHHWRQVKRRLTHRRHGGGRPDSGTSDDSGLHSMPENYAPYTTLSNVEEDLVHSPPPVKHSIKSRIKSLLNEDTYKRKGRHKRSSTCPAKSQISRGESVQHLQVDPLSELLLTVENPEPVLQTFKNHLAAGTLDVLSPVFSKKPNANTNMCVHCGTMFSSDILEHNKIHKHLSCPSQCGPEEKLMNARILTTDASPHLFKDFLDALDVINTNKDFLLEYIQDPGSPFPFHSHTPTHDHNQQSSSGKSRRTKSLSFPSCPSTPGTQDCDPALLLNQMVDEWFNAEEQKLKNQKNKQNASMHDSSDDFRQHSTPSGSSHHFDQGGGNERGYNSSLVPSQPPNNVKTRHFRDLRKKMKNIIEEGRNENKHRITMDAILDKIPRGRKLTKNVKKFMHEHSKDPTINEEGKDSATSGFGGHLSSTSFNKRQPSPMRTSSLRESAGRYSQLYETCFNSEAKYPKTENLRLRTEERNSTLKPPKSFKRFLSMPNLKSYFHHNEEPPVHLSPQNSIKKYGDRTTSTDVIDKQQRSFDHSDDSKSQILPPTFSDDTSQESSLNADQKQLLVRSTSKSGLDFSNEAKEDKGIVIEGLDKLRDSEQDIGAETESTTMPAEVNSVLSSDTSFLDVSFDLENLNIMEDSELKPGQDDGLDDMAKQQEAKEDHPEVVDIFQEFETLSQCFNYEIPCIEVDSSNEAAFNYVRKVLELSGFTGHDSLGTWYSDNQPVDPSLYDELEGCLLLDPECSGNSGEGGQCNHLLLFDIINEGLLEIFGRSYSYYPRPLSSLCNVHPLPEGEHVLYKVWTLISWYINSSTTSELYTSLDYYVSKDLAKYDGWMNLQFDSECVGLEIDDLIFDDLLVETINLHQT
ncbi:Protein TRM32, partial [Mucuna pruriens]